MLSTIYFEGEEPAGLAALLAAAIANANFDGVPGWNGLAREEPPPTAAPAASLVTTLAPTLSSVTPAPNVITGVRGPPLETDSSNLTAGGIVGVVVAGLAVLFLVLFASRNRRGARRAGAAMKHRQFTADDDDSNAAYVGEEDYHKDKAAERMVHIVGEDDSLLEAETDDGQAQQLLYATSKLAEDQSLTSHSCSSPNCELCEMKRQSGVAFVQTGEPKRPRLPPDAERSYILSDTIEL